MLDWIVKRCNFVCNCLQPKASMDFSSSGDDSSSSSDDRVKKQTQKAKVYIILADAGMTIIQKPDGNFLSSQQILNLGLQNLDAF